MRGILKKLLPNKLFGFISAEDGREMFFHRDDYADNWNHLCSAFDRMEYVEFEFDEVESNKGPRAGNVRRRRNA